VRFVVLLLGLPCTDRICIFTKTSCIMTGGKVHGLASVILNMVNITIQMGMTKYQSVSVNIH